MRRKLFRWRVFAMAAIALVVSTIALAQYVGQVRNQLDGLMVLAAAIGYEKTHQYVIDALRQGQVDSFDVTLQKGWDYAIASVCDEDCSDIDVTLYDQGGNLIDLDDSEGDLPMVEVRPRWSGVFTVRVRMYSCYSSNCVYGIGVFGKSDRRRGV